MNILSINSLLVIFLVKYLIIFFGYLLFHNVYNTFFTKTVEGLSGETPVKCDTNVDLNTEKIKSLEVKLNSFQKMHDQISQNIAKIKEKQTFLDKQCKQCNKNPLRDNMKKPN
tara:strand:- start:102 stop:440 length:339 start_codon:yes stop_codon:yes gene_type:complete